MCAIIVLTPKIELEIGIGIVIKLPVTATAVAFPARDLVTGKVAKVKAAVEHGVPRGSNLVSIFVVVVQSRPVAAADSAAPETHLGTPACWFLRRV